MSEQEEFFCDDWEQHLQQEQNEKQPPSKNEKSVQNDQTNEQEKALNLSDKIMEYKSLTLEEFQAKYKGNRLSSNGHKKYVMKDFSSIMKNDKDFFELAKSVGEKFKIQNEKETFNEEHLQKFMEELFLYLYDVLSWQNFSQVGKKLKIVKNEKKLEQKKLQKQKEKEKRLKKNQINEEEKVERKEQKKEKQWKQEKQERALNMNENDDYL